MKIIKMFSISKLLIKNSNHIPLALLTQAAQKLVKFSNNLIKKLASHHEVFNSLLKNS